MMGKGRVDEGEKGRRRGRDVERRGKRKGREEEGRGKKGKKGGKERVG